MYQPQQNFARILTLEVGELTFDCICHREGPTEVGFTFSILDEEAEEMITPSVKMDFTIPQAAESLFDERHESTLREKALAAWDRVVEALD